MSLSDELSSTQRYASAENAMNKLLKVVKKDYQHRFEIFIDQKNCQIV